MQTTAERIQVISNQIDISNQAMVEILTENNVQMREDLQDVEAARQWDAEFANLRELNSYLQRIDSILDSAEKYLFANCG